MRRITAVVVVLMITLSSYGQSTIKQLKIGDEFPGVKLKHVLNYKSDVLDLKDFRGKLVIFDFWGTTCGACVAAWPKMLELQKKFGDKIQIILVNRYESKETNKAYFEKRKTLVGVNMTLPAVCGDSILRKVFPQNGVPRYGWIDKAGRFMSLTQGRHVTELNIQKWLDDGYVPMPQFNNSYKRIDIFTPLYVDSLRSKDFISSSILTKYIPGEIGGQHLFSSPEEGYGFAVTNSPIELLYRYAYNDRNLDSTYMTWHLHRSKMRLVASDTTIYHFLSVEDGETGRAMYNYQFLSGRPMSRAEILKAMRQDLDRYFNMDVSWSTERRACLVLKMFDQGKAQYKGGERDVYLNDTDLIFDGVTVSEAIRFMEEASSYYSSWRQIVDETNYPGLLGIRSTCNCYDIKSLNQTLNKYGMSITVEERDVKVLLVKERTPWH